MPVYPGAFLDHLIRPCEQVDWNFQTNLFCSLKVNDKLKLRCLLHRQISRFGTFQNLIYVVSGLAEKVIEVRSIGHEAALIDKLLLELNSRQPVFASKVDDLLFFAEKGTIGGCHNRAHLFLLRGLKGALKNFWDQIESRSPPILA